MKLLGFLRILELWAVMGSHMQLDGGYGFTHFSYD